MKNLMKNLMFAILLTAMNAMGVVVSDVITCRIQVNTGTKSVILSLPFSELGGDPAAVKLDKIVLTDNLENGTLLFSAVNGATHAWRLTNGAWVKITAVSGFDYTPDTAGVDSFARGTAFWIERAGGEEAIAKPFYIYGLVGARMAGRQEIAGCAKDGDKVIPAYTRIGNPNPEDRNLNNLNWTGCGKNDKIVFARSDSNLGYFEYSYDAATGKWGVLEPYKDGRKTMFRWNYDKSVLPAGEAFWYVRLTEGNAEVSF